MGGGGTVLGQDVARGRVLYLALEDNARRLRKRAERQGMAGFADRRPGRQWSKNYYSDRPPTPHPAAGTAAPRPGARCGSPPRRPGRRWSWPA